MGWGSYLAMPPVVNSSSSKALYRTHLFKHNELALWYPPLPLSNALSLSLPVHQLLYLARSVFWFFGFRIARAHTDLIRFVVLWILFGL